MHTLYATAFSLVTINIGMPKHSVKKQIPNINNVALWKTFPTKKPNIILSFLNTRLLYHEGHHMV